MADTPSALHPSYSHAQLFSDLTEPDLKKAAAHFSTREFERGSFLFLEGEPAQTYYIILEGQVKILQTSVEGFEVIMHVLGPGELIGALPTLGEGDYPASAQAMTDLVAGAISASEFEGLLESHPSIVRNLLRFATRVIQASHRRLRELATERVERRIARTLSRLAGQLGRKSETGIRIDAPLSRQDLAEMTGTTVYTVSRTLKEWERQGVLLAGREEVVITDPHRLIAIGEDLPPKDSP